MIPTSASTYAPPSDWNARTRARAFPTSKQEVRERELAAEFGQGLFTGADLAHSFSGTEYRTAG
ncbi:MAG TPA: hypothetical protein VFY56_11475, partial [Propionibacteriaceae bacterium]|nr:hypothetical protein [Propionibacteriaceae bacterium]